MEATIAITGATGFIGGTLIRQLASAGCQVQALIRPASMHKQPINGGVNWIRGDLADGDSLQRLVHGADTIVHCAGAVRGASRQDFNRVNVDGVARLAQAAAKLKQPVRFLLLSSLAAREPQLSAYAASKQQGERMLMETAGKLDWAVFRPTAVYGPGEREMMPVLRLMARGVAPLIGSGNRRFSLLYAEDLADAVMQWLERGRDHKLTYELHDGHPAGYSWQELVETVARLRGGGVTPLKVPLVLVKLAAVMNLAAARALGYAPMLTPGKVREISHPDWTADNTALSQHTGWSPKIDLAEGLRRTLGLGDGRGQRTDDRGQRADDRLQATEDKGQKTENR
ncbi:MAG: SDR family NAD(P)-dependent oxidoreductase [Deltaproteobacteria bacterium]|jgi:nucleoside-diphosphate-sugar epimerase|nr:SDR family NAD(P)-dependent oxidoreductase [Deltaproteobacteria bacterium]